MNLIHEFEIIEHKDYRELKKDKPFDPKTMPMVDFWEKVKCKKCNVEGTQTGWWDEEGFKCIFGSAMPTGLCQGSIFINTGDICT